MRVAKLAGGGMRVISGKYRRLILRSLPGNDLRPTADRLRESLFNVLTAGNPNAFEGTSWIDLYAGTGAVGIEAISRGCGMVYFVESDGRAVDLIRRNLSSLRIQAGFEVLHRDALRELQTLESRRVCARYIFMDPPYKLENEYEKVLMALSGSSVLHPEGVVIAEHTKRFDPGMEYGLLRRYRLLKQGDAALSFYRK